MKVKRFASFYHTSLHERQLTNLKGMASSIASVLIQIDPNDRVAREQLQDRRNNLPEVVSSDQHPESGHSKRMQEDWPSSQKSLEDGYTSLKLQAKMLREEIEAVCALGEYSSDDDKITSNLQAISDGRVSSAVSVVQLVSVREIAREIMKLPRKCQELIVEDFEILVHWARGQDPPLGPDAIRDRLVKRKTLLEAALPGSMQKFSAAALTQIEREHLQKGYVNSQTMLLDKIENIPKENFFASEDNYAWDMEELADAITASGGVMRNPMSKELFSKSDVRMILAHPLGKRLKLLEEEQSRMKKGVRPATINWIEKLGRIMVAEEAIDAAPSRAAMDEFLAFVATIPETEQKTINSLKIEARDGFSGQAFDYTIGDSVSDAKANTTCFHKV